MTTLYRIYGEGGALLYVGITGDYDKRMRQHSEKAWWSEVRRIETEDHDDPKEAREAERLAIKGEAPKFNRAGNDRKPPTSPIPPRNVTGKRRYLSLEEAAEYLSCSTLTVRRRIADGSLPGYRMGASRTIRVDQADVDALMRPIPTVGSW